MDHHGRKTLPHEVPLSVETTRPDFFLTICLKDRPAASLTKGDTPQRILESLQFYHHSKKWWVHVAVVMPDHLHLLTSFADDMTGTVREWKRWTSRETGVRWQRGFFDHRLRHEESLREKCDYILLNPVRAGLVADWQDWPHHWIGE